ncbi:MAG: hypothetical protein P8Y64_05945 [Gammaproteobacteria bacterium]|jgi:hypothetical protein
MKPLDQYTLAELKLIYRLLHDQLAQEPALMDSELLEDLQRYLQGRAGEDGVDVSLHAQWAAWLNEGVKLRGL